MCFCSKNVDFQDPGGSPSGGFSIHGGSPSTGGVLHPGGFSILGGLHPGGVLHPRVGGGVSIWGGMSCDLSHHAFDVTCMLPPHQLSGSN